MEQKDLENLILSVIKSSEIKMTLIDLKKRLLKIDSTLNSKSIRSAISTLMQEKEIQYTYIYGNSFIERSFNRPVKVSGHVILIPAGLKKKEFSGIEVFLNHGASFGTGEHPTTRLAIRGLEYIWENSGRKLKNQRALDIGTGSGVLAIVAARFGLRWVDAVDIDPCARAEAINNVKLNGLMDRICVSDKNFCKMKTSYDLVIANLRFPTIMEIVTVFDEISAPEGWVVISGIKEEEATLVRDKYKKYGLDQRWYECELGWSGLVFSNLTVL